MFISPCSLQRRGKEFSASNFDRKLKMKLLLLCLFAVVFAAEEVKEEENVLVLTDSNFDEVKAANKMTMKPIEMLWRRRAS